MSNFPTGPNLTNPQLSNQLPGGTGNQQSNKMLGNATPTVFPWGTPTSQSRNHSTSSPRFFFPITIAGDRWNKLYPYRFLVIDTTKGNQVVNGPANSAGTSVLFNAGSNGNFTLAFENLTNQWVFQLPITPEQLNITDLFAITTSATLRGVMEEHNGVKFKPITASGTFGVWPSRPNITAPPGTPSLVQSLFGGTLEAVGNLVNAAHNVVNTFTTGHPATKPKTIQPEESDAGLASTGYYQALFLEQFL